MQNLTRGTLEQRALESTASRDRAGSVVLLGRIGPTSLRPSVQLSFLCHAKRQSSMKERGVGVSRRSGDYSVLDDSVRSELD
ncbi:hypothetical protein PsorP6_015582 [Peronosclerospora sorghi]|uniref:Uncharacterized protein n=1 Tax=Peronosclerospora sorghi TaxID=230839 RepID=A0ACC0WP73_9STRA|nr:hypothetical protein PsorP6_015582 [Peronosclerospora sorghi]